MTKFSMADHDEFMKRQKVCSEDASIVDYADIILYDPCPSISLRSNPVTEYSDSTETTTTSLAGRVLNHRVVSRQVNVPKKVLREHVTEKLVVVPETVLREEIVDEIRTVKETIVEVRKPIYRETVLEVPEIEYREKPVEVAQKVIKERIRHVPKLEYRERLIDCSRKPPPEAAASPPNTSEDVETHADSVVIRTIPIPVEANILYAYAYPHVLPRTTRLSYPVYAPHFIPVPVVDLCVDDQQELDTLHSLQAGLSHLVGPHAPSLSEVEELALSIQHYNNSTSFGLMETHTKLLSNIREKWRTGSLVAVSLEP